MELRKWAVSVTIAVLLAIFVNASIEAFYKAPQYNDFCKEQFYPEPIRPVAKPIDANGGISGGEAPKCPDYIDANSQQRQECMDKEGYISYKRDANSCPTEFYCELCQKNFDDAQKGYNNAVFILSALLGLAAIVIGLMLPIENENNKNENNATPNQGINEWIGSGLIIGGLITIFVGTIRAYESINPILRPAAILGELLLVIYLARKRLAGPKGGQTSRDHKKRLEKEKKVR